MKKSDLEEVKKQIGLEGSISDIFEQFGAGNTGKISYKQFCENSQILFGDQVYSSESSPEYCSTDSETAAKELQQQQKQLIHQQKQKQQVASKRPMASEKGRGKEDVRKEKRFADHDTTDLDEELKASGDKIKQIAESFALDPHYNPHRKSGGGFEDYLDEKTLARLEELKIIPNQPISEKPSYAVHHASISHSRQPKDDFASASSGPDYLEISKKLHLAALTSYKNEIYELNTRLHKTRGERDHLRKQQSLWSIEKQKMQKDFEERLQSQTMRITELQSVIAELTRKLNAANDNKIIEEEEEDFEENDEDEDEDARSRFTSDIENQGSRACSECSSEHCDCQNHLDIEGPNQVNLLATTKDLIRTPRAPNQDGEELPTPESAQDNNDLTVQLHRVLGALESNIELRKQNKPNTDATGERSNVSNAADASEVDLESNFLGEAREEFVNPSSLLSPDSMMSGGPQITEMLKQIDNLRKEKRDLEKQLQENSIQGFVNAGHGEEEFSKLRQENSYLRSKLRKSEQELDEVKTSNIAFKEERERLKKKTRSIQESADSLDQKSSSDTQSSPHHGHRRSHSTHIDRSQSPVAHQRSSSVAADRSTMPAHRSNSMTSGSPTLHKRSHSEARSSPNSSLGRLPTQSSSSVFAMVNNKGYTVSPENSLRRQQQQQMDSSDLGSSIGDESQRNVLNQALVRNVRGKIPEELLQTLMAYTSVDPILKHLANHFVAEIEERTKEGLINVERLESKLSHLQAQKNLIHLSLQESKQNAENLSLLCGKYESNSTAWSLALQNTEELLETYEVMLQLQESEADIFSRNCQAIGVVGNFDTIKSMTSTKSSQSNISIASSSSHIGFEDEDILKSYHSKRKDLETQAKNILLQLDKKYDNASQNPSIADHDELSYKSRTSTGSSMNSTCTDTLSKDEEHRLRDYIKRLKSERNTYKATVNEKLESVNEYFDPPQNTSGLPSTDRSEKRNFNMNLEMAVILEDMEALKEERAELKHNIYLLEKEKRALELKMNAKDAQEQAYIVHIEHLKSEVKDQLKKRRQMLKDAQRKGQFSVMEDETLSIHSGSTQTSSNQQYSSTEEIQTSDSSRRERKLKQRIQELVDTLETLSKNSEIRHKQTNEYISDLKRANGALVTAYEKAKKRHARRLKKFEQQVVQIVEKYQYQVKQLKEQIKVLKDTPPSTLQTPQTETSL
ncbi:colorectal mutant cancer protein-like isoform X3 [Clytia hemisphaerica]|uniref:colorectal mutant cancer protein-like isoform X3 n=1 Tax=Clytia hemisphaerica TaxID=252671 RepID=UPI0034D4AC7A